MNKLPSEQLGLLVEPITQNDRYQGCCESSGTVARTITLNLRPSPLQSRPDLT
jgi:hypothetical protein